MSESSSPTVNERAVATNGQEGVASPKPGKGEKRLRCADLKAGETVASTFLLSGVEQRAKKNGDPYFSLKLTDATGTVPAVMWDRHEPLVDGRVGQDDLVWVEAGCADYQGALQLTLRNISRVDDSDVDLSDFIPSSHRPRKEMEAELDALVAGVQQADCRRLLERFFGHARLRELFCTAPAAARVHQAYLGGLLEHTLNVVANALDLARRYPPVDRDLLVTAGLLHDLGKIREYDWRRTISYTDDGRLLGHISMGANMVDQAMRQMKDFPLFYHRHILHLILSHHGKLEFGSPVVPKTKEALILHYADYSEAFLTSYQEAVTEAQGRGQSWTTYNRIFDTYLYAGGPVADASPAETLRSARSAGEERDPMERASHGGSVDDPG